MNATQSRIESSNAEYNEDDVSYRCPRCGIEYDHEILVRTHIHRSEDKDHLNWHGFMPETEIEVVNEDGEVIGITSKSKNEINVRDLQLEDIPDEYSDEHKCIILAGAYYYDNDEYTKTDGTGLEGAANGILKENGFDTLSYSTVRRVLREFYRPQEVKAEREQKEKRKRKERGEETLSDLTPKQQAIIIRKLAKPNEANKQIGEKIGDSAPSYPKQVYEDRAPETYTRLKQLVEEGNSVKEAVQTELTDDDIASINSHNFELGIELPVAESTDTDEHDASTPDETDSEEVFDMGVGEQRKAMSANPFASTDDASTDSAWETEDTSTESAETTSVESNETDIDEPIQVADEVKASQPESEQPTGTTPSEPETQHSVTEGVPREAVEELHKKIEWYLEIEKKAGTSGENRQLAFAEKMEEEISTLLDA